MNLANETKKAATAEGLTYWEYIKKNQGSKKVHGITYKVVNTAALIAHENYLKEQKRKEKFASRV